VIDNLVSTIIPVFNRAGMLREAVESVLAQTWRPIEIVIVDDGSTDETPQVEEQLREAFPEIVRVLHQGNAGPGAARQAGMSIAQGEFVQFLDSDDRLLPDKFSLQVRGLRSDAEAGISYGKSYIIRDGARVFGTGEEGLAGQSTLFPNLLSTRIWQTAAPLYRHELLLRIGPWPTKRTLEDWEYDSLAGAMGVKLHYCEEYVSEYVNHPGLRLCQMWMVDSGAMKDRISAYFAVHKNAVRAGMRQDAPEMQRFARSLFWMARNAGVYGLTDEAEQLFRLARSIEVRPGLEYRVFSASIRLLGWRRTSVLAESIGRWLR